MGNSPRYVGFIDPPYIVTLTDDSGAALDLTGCTSSSFTLTMLNQNTNLAQQGVGVWTVANQTTNKGQASYQWTNADMATAGPWWIYSTVKLPAEPSPREFDPELILILAGTVGAGAAPPGVLPAPIAGALYINVRDYGARGDGITDDTAAIKATINALTPCSVRDVGGNLVAGQTGVIFLPPGIYKISSLLTLPPGDITIQGSGLSSWVPGASLTPYQNLGGSVIVTTDYTDGLLTCPKDAFNFPTTALFLRDIEFRTVSPVAAQSSSTPPIVSLSGMISGEVSNVNVLEVQTGGGIGQNLFKIFSLESGSATDYKYIYNVHGYGGTESIVLNATHLAAINMSGGNIGSNVGGVTACCIMILQNDDNYFANIHCFSGVNGIASNFGNDNNHPIIIHGSQFESVTHYLTTCFSPSQGTLILENPTWNSSVDPTTDIPSQIPSTIAVISKYEVDRTGLYNPTRVLHVAPAKTSQTAGASPYTFTVNQYDQVVVVTTVGGMTALTLDGQALFNNAFSVGQQIYVGAGHTLIATWATTAPVFRLLPQ